ncbi:MAG: 3-deoxy-7-phosphoheptulonate synthase [Candidatus Omnitrophica bacterium]|nr:3-deoxy-7-phosphoheptulonate synthase [Candidatus Omnitrophota bacterium]
MIIVLKPDATEQQITHLVKRVKALGLKPMISKGVERTIIGVIGEEDVLRVQPLEIFPGVEKVVPILAPYKLVSREFKPNGTVISLNSHAAVGGKPLVIMAGPCAVENYETLLAIAKSVKKAGATVLRGGAYKPRTSPYSFQGLEEEGLKYLKDVSKKVGMLTITELMDVRDLDLVERHVDIIQIGARNMQNFDLLKEVGLSKKPVLLKRGMASTIKEWLLSAEYILQNGNFNVMLCERGIRTFETDTRFTLDINAVPVIKGSSHLPVIVDPSHSTGRWGLVPAIAKAGIAAGADGLLIEVHNKPEEALCDGPQSILPDRFAKLMGELKRVARAVGRDL